MKLQERVRWDVERLYWQLRKVLLRLRVGSHWQEQDGVVRRSYPDYDTYVEHQKTKFGALRAKSIIGHDRRFHEALTERLAGMAEQLRGRSVLCLAARQGTEVRAFIDQGAFAVGIDLNPGRRNSYVVVGDFHALQYADDSVDIVYTNSLDHAFDLDRILVEVRRVLKPDGMFLVEANINDEGGVATPGPYESTAWNSADELVSYITARAFRLEARAPISRPWRGEQLVLRPTA